MPSIVAARHGGFVSGAARARSATASSRATLLLLNRGEDLLLGLRLGSGPVLEPSQVALETVKRLSLGFKSLSPNWGASPLSRSACWLKRGIGKSWLGLNVVFSPGRAPLRRQGHPPAAQTDATWKEVSHVVLRILVSGAGPRQPAHGQCLF